MRACIKIIIALLLRMIPQSLRGPLTSDSLLQKPGFCSGVLPQQQQLQGALSVNSMITEASLQIICT